jgi:two-component system NarL family sensor kinase
MSLKWKIVALAILPLAVATIAVAWVVAWQSNRLAEHEATLVASSLMDQKRSELRHAVALVTGELDVLRSETDGARVVERAKALIAAARYDTDGYFFAYDGAGTCLVHPTQPELVGKNLWALRDSGGRRVIPELVGTARHGSGFQQYTWAKPSSGRETEKLAYVALWPQLGWVVGTGVYLDDVAAATEAVRTEAHRGVVSTMWRLAAVFLSAVALVFGGTMALNLNEQRAADRRLEIANHKLVKVRTREQTRIARDLHEGVLQLLAAAKFQFELGERQLEANLAGARSSFAVGRERLQSAIADVRGIAHARQPLALERLGWSRALADLAREFTRRTGVKLAFDDALGGAPPPEPYASELYRIVQECLTNVERHAAATAVELTVRRDAVGDLHLRVSDDGRGFDPERVVEAAESGLGLRHVRERVEDLHGTFNIESTPGHTELSVHVRVGGGT